MSVGRLKGGDGGQIDYAIDASGVSVVTINRPEKLNALTPRLAEQLMATMERADADDTTRVILLTGTGRGFCAGADINGMAGRGPEDLKASYDLASRDAIYRCRKPVICAINGSVAGIGLAFALMADVRFAANTAKWSTSFTRLGLPAELGLSWLMVRLAGTSRAADLMFTSRVFTSGEALEYGLADFICADDNVMDDAVEYCRTVAAHDGATLMTIKDQLRQDVARDWDGGYRDSVKRILLALKDRNND